MCKYLQDLGLGACGFYQQKYSCDPSFQIVHIDSGAELKEYSATCCGSRKVNRQVEYDLP